MLKIAIGIFIGVIGYQIYLNPDQKDDILNKVKDGINSGASVVQEFTKDQIIGTEIYFNRRHYTR